MKVLKKQFHLKTPNVMDINSEVLRYHKVDTFLTFFVAIAKREHFIWKRKHEAMLLREVLVEEPYKYRPGSKERGISWTKIANICKRVE